ncbi:class I SAM-dependent methyltransferase [Streptomyces sp. NPDC046261]|uniref:class I SAM-dependent methyltransferase n=1 Tax=Streptomyces sp. NPDC046261 TaxID=3157200 RepID=UPI00340DED14
MADDRSRPGYRLRYALRHPERVMPYARRWARDAWLRATSADHVAYYRKVMRSDLARSADAAVGSKSRERWLELGRLQFDYLREHGLTPEDRMLEIGCGNLRAGWRFIQYLQTGHYYGIDISPGILLAAQRTVTEFELRDKLPHLAVVDNLTFDFLPDEHFTVVHAHSVFSHSPLPVVDECLRHVSRILHPGGFFDFTFDRTDGAEHHVLREDFYYRPQTLIDLARRHGLTARLMQDWEALPHRQSKIRVARAETA